jgi:hypothetical protein
LCFFLPQFNFFIAWGRNATPKTLQSGGNRSGDGQISFEVEVSDERESQEDCGESKAEVENEKGCGESEGPAHRGEGGGEDAREEETESCVHETSSP